MANEVLGEHDFRWTVPQAGFQWLERKVFIEQGHREYRGLSSRGSFEQKPRWVLTSGVATGHPFDAFRYRPLRTYTGLFRTFIETAQTREGILAFANKYGNLGIGRPLHWPIKKNSKQMLLMFGELFDEWVREIEEMRRAVMVWDMVESGAQHELSRFLRWYNAEAASDLRPAKVRGWVYNSHPEIPEEQLAEIDMQCMQFVEPATEVQLGPDELFTAARFLYQRWINAHLEGQASPRLLYHTDLGKQVLRVVPKNLIGAMWLQFAQTIDGKKEHRPCKECGKYFEVSLDEGGFRINRVFCTDACKSRDYRHRSKQAAELRKEGKSVTEIAKLLETDLATIKKWIAKGKK